MRIVKGQVIVEGRERAVVYAGEESEICPGREINRKGRFEFATWADLQPLSVSRRIGKLQRSVCRKRERWYKSSSQKRSLWKFTKAICVRMDPE